jgi:CRP-like cAMP-binding protein
MTDRSTKNYILNRLPDEEFKLLLPELKEVSLKLGDVVNRPYEPIRDVLFPDNAMISVITGTPGGQLSEAGVVGHEGMLGIAVVLGAEATPHENIVQLAGTALKLSAKSIGEYFERCPALRKLLLRFTHAHMMQVTQTALCNRIHHTEQRLARWILMTHDRSDSDVLGLTQELLSIMLGVHRPSVSHVAGRFKKAGFIQYQRGRITVLDRNGTKRFAAVVTKSCKANTSLF